MTHQLIIKNIAKGFYAPIYFLHGEEPFYIDLIEKFATSHIVKEDAKDFDQTILYGKDIDLQSVINSAKRFPMMGPHQVISVREAQNFKKFDELIQYAKKPQNQTILIFSFKGKKLDTRILRKLKENVEFFESKKLYDNQIPDWIKNVLLGRGRSIDPKAAQMLVDFLGNDLSKMNKELEKLILVVPENQKIDAGLIEQHIGVSKDYNNFELQSAIASGDRLRAYAIATYFAENPKNHPVIMTIALLYNFFTKLLLYHSISDKSIAPKILGVNPYFIKEYQNAAKLFPMRRISVIISGIRLVDMKSKGLGTVPLKQKDLLQELLLVIFD